MRIGTHAAGQSAQANICAATHRLSAPRATPRGTACSARTYATSTRYRMHVSENTCLRKAGIPCTHPYLPHLLKPPSRGDRVRQRRRRRKGQRKEERIYTCLSPSLSLSLSPCLSEYAYSRAHTHTCEIAPTLVRMSEGTRERESERTSGYESMRKGREAKRE